MEGLGHVLQGANFTILIENWRPDSIATSASSLKEWIA